MTITSRLVFFKAVCLAESARLLLPSNWGGPSRVTSDTASVAPFTPFQQNGFDPSLIFQILNQPLNLILLKLSVPVGAAASLGYLSDVMINSFI
jgi:hypothetical protein